MPRFPLSNLPPRQIMGLTSTLILVTYHTCGHLTWTSTISRPRRQAPRVTLSRNAPVLSVRPPTWTPPALQSMVRRSPVPSLLSVRWLAW